ncbi:hypothetical protein HK100_002439 [Physocladia obscura]|uniref:Uncharacterized protein n=1 Tax=Physocladia obscura TaxID=109957 RepID=A0AAD5T7Y1_9FUNG|nr:hypothetical protein HK100_002439 [Physocladia obscura]
MITYLESMFPVPSLVLTADDPLKDECTEWARFIRSECIPALNKVLMGTNPTIQQEFRPKLKAAIKKISEKLAVSFWGAYMLPDLLLSPFLRRVEVTKYFRGVDFFAIANSEIIKEYVAVLGAQDWVRKVVAPIDEMKNSARAYGEHEHEVPETRKFQQQLNNALEKIGSDGNSEFEGLVLKLKTLAQSMKEHMDGEESELFPLTANLGEREAPLFTKIYFHLSKSSDSLLPFIFGTPQSARAHAIFVQH